MSVSRSLFPDRSEPRNTAAPQAEGMLRTLTAVLFDPTLRTSAVSVLDQGVVSGTSFATSVVIGRMCSQGELGVFYLALSIVLFLRGVQGDVISVPYTIYCSRRRGRELASYAGSALVHQLALSALATACLLGLAGVLSLGGGPSGLAPVAWVLLGCTPLLLLREYIRSFAFAHLQLGTALALDISVAVLQLGSLVLLACFGMLTVPTAYFVMGAACAIACLGWFLAKQEPLCFVRSRITVDWRHNWSFGKWALAGQLAGRTTTCIVPWIVAFAHGEAATGILAACITLVNLSGTFVTGMTRFLTPKAAHAFAQGGLDELRHVLRNAALVFATVLGCFCLFVLVAGDSFATIVYGGKFAGCGPILAILAFSMLADSMGITAGNGLWAVDRPRENFAADVCTLVVTLTVALCLVYPLAATGAAIGMLAGKMAGTGVRCSTFLRLARSLRYVPKEA